jgi:hypothetical protein
LYNLDETVKREEKLPAARPRGYEEEEEEERRKNEIKGTKRRRRRRRQTNGSGCNKFDREVNQAYRRTSFESSDSTLSLNNTLI